MIFVTKQTVLKQRLLRELLDPPHSKVVYASDQYQEDISNYYLMLFGPGTEIDWRDDLTVDVYLNLKYRN
jgi:hypothetical protein